MAKKKPASDDVFFQVEDGTLFKIDNTPERVKKFAEKYRASLTAHNRGLQKMNTDKDNLIEVMKEEDCQFCVVEVGGKRKVVRLVEEPKIKIEKPVDPPQAGEA